MLKKIKNSIIEVLVFCLKLTFLILSCIVLFVILPILFFIITVISNLKNKFYSSNKKTNQQKLNNPFENKEDVTDLPFREIKDSKEIEK